MKHHVVDIRALLRIALPCLSFPVVALIIGLHGKFQIWRFGAHSGDTSIRLGSAIELDNRSSLTWHHQSPPGQVGVSARNP